MCTCSLRFPFHYSSTKHLPPTHNPSLPHLFLSLALCPHGAGGGAANAPRPRAVLCRRCACRRRAAGRVAAGLRTGKCPAPSPPPYTLPYPSQSCKRADADNSTASAPAPKTHLGPSTITWMCGGLRRIDASRTCPHRWRNPQPLCLEPTCQYSSLHFTPRRLDLSHRLDIFLFPFPHPQFSWNRLCKYRACSHCLRSLEPAQDMARSALCRDWGGDGSRDCILIYTPPLYSADASPASPTLSCR